MSKVLEMLATDLSHFRGAGFLRLPRNTGSFPSRRIFALAALFWAIGCGGNIAKAEDQPSNEAQQRSPDRVVVFIRGAVDPARAGSLEDALKAHCSDIDVTLVIEPVDMQFFEFNDLMERSKARAEQDGAIGVFWLDISTPNDWLLYLVDPKGERALARRIRAPASSTSAAIIEVVAVISRNAAYALAHGRNIEVQTLVVTTEAEAAQPAGTEAGKPGEPSRKEKIDRVKIEEIPIHIEQNKIYPEDNAAIEVARPEPPSLVEGVKLEATITPAAAPASEPEAKAAPPAKPRRKGKEPARHEARFSAAYRGNTFADQETWQSGLSLWGGWIMPFGWYVGVGYLLVSGVHVKPSAGEVTVERHPIEAFCGHRYRNGRLSAYGEIAFVFDVMTRRAGEAPAGAETSQDRTGLALAISPRGSLEWAIIGDFGAFIGFAIEDYLRNFDYVAELPGRETLLSPRKLRAAVDIGIAFHL